MKVRRWFVAAAVLSAGCAAPEKPLVDRVEVPTVVGKNPAQALSTLEAAGFRVKLTRPKGYCIPSDPLCSGSLNDLALRKLVVDAQSGTKGRTLPVGSTITLTLGSPVHEVRTKD